LDLDRDRPFLFSRLSERERDLLAAFFFSTDRDREREDFFSSRDLDLASFLTGDRDRDLEEAAAFFFFSSERDRDRLALRLPSARDRWPPPLRDRELFERDLERERERELERDLDRERELLLERE
jgi:hypothetical protein